MIKFKGLFLLLCFAAIIFTSCSKDDQAPVIANFKVNAVATTANAGGHLLGTTVQFDFDATDDSELGAYQVKNESDGSALIASGDLDGVTASVSFSFVIDVNDYIVGDDVLLSFIVEDQRGSSTIKTYNIDVQ